MKNLSDLGLAPCGELGGVHSCPTNNKQRHQTMLTLLRDLTYQERYSEAFRCDYGYPELIKISKSYIKSHSGTLVPDRKLPGFYTQKWTITYHQVIRDGWGQGAGYSWGAGYDCSTPKGGGRGDAYYQDYDEHSESTEYWRIEWTLL